MSDMVVRAPGEPSPAVPPVAQPQQNAAGGLAQGMWGSLVIRMGADAMLRNTTAPGEDQWG